MAVTNIPNVQNWTVTPQNGQSGYFDLMNTWLGQSTLVIASLQSAITAQNAANAEINTLASQAESNAIIATGLANYQGEYIALTTYSKGQSVSVAGLYYTSKVDGNSNHAVTDTTYWVANPINNKANGTDTGFKNYIINGKKVVNQRGLTSTNNSYNQDRWHKVDNNWFQGIEGDNNLISGKTYTLSWAGAATASYYVGTATSATINTQTFTSIANGGNFTLTISAGQNLWIKFASDSTGSTFNFVQLERGTIATPFEHRPYGLELILCQRYLPSSVGYISGYASTASEVYLSVPTSIIPRTAPNGILFNLGGIVYYTNVTSPITSITFFAGVVGANQTLKVKVTGSPLAVGQGAMVNLPTILFLGCEL